MNPHRIHVLHTADGDGRVRSVAENLELDLFPAEQAALHQHLTDGADIQAVRNALTCLGVREREAASPAPEREGRSDDDRLAE